MQTYLFIGLYCVLFWAFWEEPLLRILAGIRAGRIELRGPPKKLLPPGQYFLGGIAATIIFFLWPGYLLALLVKVLMVLSGYKKEVTSG